MVKALQELADHVASAAKDAVISTELAYGEVTVVAHVEKLISLLTFLRDDPLCAFGQLIDITAVDRPNRSERFELVYHLLSMTLNQRIRVKVCAGEETQAPTAVELFPNADWYEREVFDLYGILFAGHPDLRRLLTDYGFQGHPLRKDFPLTGFVEVRYDEEEKRVVYEDVQLQQEYRDFDFISPWEGMTRELPGDEKAGG